MIAFDNSVSMKKGTVNAGVLSFGFTCMGNNRIVFAVGYAPGFNIVSATYFGVAMTKLDAIISDTIEVSLWYLVAPSTISATVQLVGNASSTVYGWAASYTGVKQTSPIEAHGTASGTGTSYSQSLTSTSKESWGIMAAFDNNLSAVTADLNTILRQTDTTLLGAFLADSGGGKTPAGTITLATNIAQSVTIGSAMAVFAQTPHYTDIAKPTTQTYTKLSKPISQSYTNISKPSTQVYTKTAKPTVQIYTNV